MAYVLNVDDLERQVLVLQQAAATANAMGGQADAPELGVVRREFDEWLLSEPELVDVAAVEWKHAMGVA